jgi:hypothetical protein
MTPRKVKHGHAPDGHSSPTYRSWDSARQRCTNPNNPEYHRYGGRGITFYPPWMDFRVFLAYMGERPPGTWIDRIDPNGNYEPGNVRWATPKEQGKNKRPRYPDLTGMVFNRLTVLGCSHRSPRGARYWLCQCICGNQTVMAAYRFRSGATKSCGCLKRRRNDAS